MSPLVKDNRHLLFFKPVPDRATKIGGERRRKELVQFAELRERQIPVAAAPCLIDLA